MLVTTCGVPLKSARSPVGPPATFAVKRVSSGHDFYRQALEAEAGADLSRNGRTLTAAVSVSNNSRTSVKMRSARLSKQTLSAHAAADQATPRSTWAQLQTCSKQKQCSHDASQANLNWNVPEIRPMSCQTQLHTLGNFKQLCEASQEQGGGKRQRAPLHWT